MVIHRIVPNLNVADAQAGHEFYTEFLGLEKEFDLGWIASFRAPDNRAAQVSLVSGDATAAEDSVLSVGVGDVDAAYARAQQLGYEIVHPPDPRAVGSPTVLRPRPARQRHQHRGSPRLRTETPAATRPPRNADMGAADRDPCCDRHRR